MSYHSSQNLYVIPFLDDIFFMKNVSIVMSDALVTILLLNNQRLNSEDGYVETSLLKVHIFYCFDKVVPLLALKNLICNISVVNHEGHTSWNYDFG